jgi:hypothetical protein
MPETTRSRFIKTMRGEMPEDRMPIMEWATWWHLTINRWKEEGLDPALDYVGIKREFGLDIDYQLWFDLFKPTAKQAGAEWIADEKDYDALRPHLYPDPPALDRALWAERAEEQARGEAVVWFTLNGFFWWPRVLLGIEPHLYAFYDQPDLIKKINEDLVEDQLRCVDALCEVCTPDFMTFAEDMSYNHGPMLSKETFDEFLAPYYRRIVPELKRRGIVVIVDSDGQVEPMIPWLEEVGLEGILPLERMAGVDVARIRANHPNWKMVGGFDKTVMHLGEGAIRTEFERLLPVMKTGGFIPSVDHQTPPGVSLEDYKLFLKVFREYAALAAAK